MFYRHKRKGDLYRLLKPGEPFPLGSRIRMQVRSKIDDMQEAVAYVNIFDSSIVWIRARAAFFDGRFEEVDSNGQT